MRVHIVKPYSLDKNLGRAYNEVMSRIPVGDWACLMDYDTMFLTSDAISILHEYAGKYPDTGLFTCYTNRIHPLSHYQLLNGFSENDSIKFHIEIAEKQKEFRTLTQIDCLVSGFLMMISRATWDQIKFDELGKCLGVDNNYCTQLLARKKTICRMNALYVWHSYRLLNGRLDKTHLL